MSNALKKFRRTRMVSVADYNGGLQVKCDFEEHRFHRTDWIEGR